MQGGKVDFATGAADCQFVLGNHAGTLRDVKNEDRSGYVHENTGDDDKMSSEKHGFYTKMQALRGHRQQSVGLLGRRRTDYGMDRGEMALIFRADHPFRAANTADSRANVCASESM
jgi:hypothetical protein